MIPSPATRPASSDACRRPVSFRGVSRKPWTRIGSRLSSVSPWRASRTPGAASFIDGLGGAGAGGVRAQTEPDRLQRENVLRDDVAEVDLGPEATHEPHLLVLLGRLEEQAVDFHSVDDLIDQAHAGLAVVAEDS